LTPREAFERVESGESPEEVARELERSWWAPLGEVFVVVCVVGAFLVAMALASGARSVLENWCDTIPVACVVIGE